MISELEYQFTFWGRLGVASSRLSRVSGVSNQEESYLRSTVEALQFPPQRISPPLHVCRGFAKRSRLDHQPLLQAETYLPAVLAIRLASARTIYSAIYAEGESGLLRTDSTLEDHGAQSGRTLPHESPPARINTDGFQLVRSTGLIYIPELFAISKTYLHSERIPYIGKEA